MIREYNNSYNKVSKGWGFNQQGLGENQGVA